VSLEITRLDIATALQRLFGLRGAPGFSLEQGILPVTDVWSSSSPYPSSRPFEYQTDVGAIAGNFSYFYLWVPNTLQGDQRCVIEEIWTYANAAIRRHVWDVQSLPPFNNTRTLIPDLGFGEVPRFDNTTAISLTQSYFTPLVRDVSQSATDYIIAGRDIPAQNATWVRVPTQLILPIGACWVVRPDAVNTQLTIRVKGRFYAG